MECQNAPNKTANANGITSTTYIIYTFFCFILYIHLYINM